MQINHDHLFGLIGFPLTHSFSKKYFTEKFEKEGLANHRYELFPLENSYDLPRLIEELPCLSGLNVTIPHKQAVIPFLDEIDEEAKAIGAVNVIQFRGGKLKGYNSDAYGFEHSLRKFLGENLGRSLKLKLRPRFQALVLGTGGAAKGITFVLEKMGIKYQLVSRKEKKHHLTYRQLDADIMAQHQLIINCTPLGTYPDIELYPDIPYEAVGSEHYFYDLVYNPAETTFMKKAKAQGAHTINGLEMLHLQAERAWEIWNDQ